MWKFGSNLFNFRTRYRSRWWSHRMRPDRNNANTGRGIRGQGCQGGRPGGSCEWRLSQNSTFQGWLCEYTESDRPACGWAPGGRGHLNSQGENWIVNKWASIITPVISKSRVISVTPIPWMKSEYLKGNCTLIIKLTCCLLVTRWRTYGDACVTYLMSWMAHVLRGQTSYTFIILLECEWGRNTFVIGVPHFLEEPENRKATANQSMAFLCTAWGEPEPDVQCDFNGVPIKFHRRIYVTKNGLTITNVTHDDRGIYGCNASNSLGFVYKSVRLNVFGNLWDSGKRAEGVKGVPHFLHEPDNRNDRTAQWNLSARLGGIQSLKSSGISMECRWDGTQESTWPKTASSSLMWHMMMQEDMDATHPISRVLSTKVFFWMFLVSNLWDSRKKQKGTKSRGTQLFKTSRNHLKIIGARKVTQRKFHTEAASVV